MRVKIEKLKPADWRKFYELFRRIVIEDFAYYPPEAIDRFLDPRRIQRNWGKTKEIFIALKSGEIIGFLIGVDEGGGVSFCNWLGVRKEFRGQGIGGSLVRAWEKWAKTRGCHKLRARTSKEQNQTFFQKLGFELEGVKKNDRYHLDYWLLGKII